MREKVCVSVAFCQCEIHIHSGLPWAGWSLQTGVVKKLIAISVLLFALVCGGVAADNVRVYFSPDGGCTEAVVGALDAARTSVNVQAYSFTSEPIARALVNAHKRGVKVAVILDKSNESEKYSSATFLKNYGVPTWIDDKHAIAHNKVMIIDGQTVVTGSFNFTKAAEQSNAENLLLISDAPLAAQYQANWDAHFKHCKRYKGKSKPKQPSSSGWKIRLF
jgi:phosphatidylserine/phosphatidylglycerophosphate/cardiolipin synthase-like enzyme